MYDCIVIGGGVVGTAVLDALSTRGYKTLLIEKEDDVAVGGKPRKQRHSACRIRLRPRNAESKIQRRRQQNDAVAHT